MSTNSCCSVDFVFSVKLIVGVLISLACVRRTEDACKAVVLTYPSECTQHASTTNAWAESFWTKCLAKREGIVRRERDTLLVSFVARSILFLLVFDTSTQCLHVRQNKSTLEDVSTLSLDGWAELTWWSIFYERKVHAQPSILSYNVGNVVYRSKTNREKVVHVNWVGVDNEIWSNMRRIAWESVKGSWHWNFTFPDRVSAGLWRKWHWLITRDDEHQNIRLNNSNKYRRSVRKLRREVTDTETFIIVDDEKILLVFWR